MSDNEDQEVEIKKTGKNLKIVFDNENANKEEELFSYEELQEEESGTGHVTIDAKMDIDETVANEANALPAEEEKAEEEEDSTEFHVNLDKAPPTLKNTVLV